MDPQADFQEARAKGEKRKEELKEKEAQKNMQFCFEHLPGKAG